MTELVCNLGYEAIGSEGTQGGTSFERGVGGVPRLELYFRLAPMSV